LGVRRWALGAACWAWGVGALAGCATPPTPTAAGTEPPELRVAAAADLTKAFTEIAAAYRRETGQKVTLTFGSTGLLTKQIENGAPFDVFAAANASYIAQLEKEGHTLPGTAQLYALGRLALWTRKGGPACPTWVGALIAPRYDRIAIANPEHAPYGAAAREAMQAAKLWTPLRAHLVYGENVQQALQYAQSGNADVAIVALSLAIGSNGDYTPIPPEMHRPLRQVMAALKSTQQPEAAKRFVAFVNGPEGRPIMRKYGFLLPDEKLTAAR
jgi:molybdate transport system substrate-binding protein